MSQDSGNEGGILIAVIGVVIISQKCQREKAQYVPKSSGPLLSAEVIEQMKLGLVIGLVLTVILFLWVAFPMLKELMAHLRSSYKEALSKADIAETAAKESQALSNEFSEKINSLNDEVEALKMSLRSQEALIAKLKTFTKFDTHEKIQEAFQDVKGGQSGEKTTYNG